MHPGLRMGVLRGEPVEHPKYQGRRIFSAGINLTRIYQGKQSYLFYLTRDMGLLNKMYRLLPCGVVDQVCPCRVLAAVHAY